MKRGHTKKRDILEDKKYCILEVDETEKLYDTLNEKYLYYGVKKFN